MNMPTVFIYDPTASDPLSRVRGIGRYMQILHEQFENEWTFTADLKNVLFDSTFINPFFNAISPPLITKRIAKKQIAVIHDLIPLKYPKHFPIGLRGKINVYRNKQAIKQYDTFVTDSEASKKNIVSILNIDPENIHVIYPPVSKTFLTDTQLLDKGSGLPATDYRLPSTVYCLYVGDATWNKNLVNLAKAVKKTDVSCVFAGKVFAAKLPVQIHPWQKELQEFKSITENDPRFVFPGFLPDEVLADLYKHALCNILVSRDEGFGFSYLEAAAVGVPSVLADIEVLRETAHDSALFADPENPDDIAEKILQFKSDMQIRNSYAQASKTRAGFFSTDSFKQKLQDICNQ